VARIHPGIAAAVAELPSLLPRSIDDRITRITELDASLGGNKARFDRADRPVIGGLAVQQSSLWAILCVLSHPDSPFDAICAAISAGGDADTTAAMAGGIAGARCGAEGLPLALASQLRDEKCGETLATLMVLAEELGAAGGGVRARAEDAAFVLQQSEV
jgi:ADP-ribosylglycohydrolase